MYLLRNDQRVRLAICVGVPMIFGILSGLLNFWPIMSACRKLHKPPFTLPGILSILFWLVIYFAIGLASFLVLESHVYKEEKRIALLACACQLVLHSFWIFSFFHTRLTLLGALLHLIYTAAVGLNTLLYLKIDQRAGLLMFPCATFCIYYTYLTIALIFVN